MKSNSESIYDAIDHLENNLDEIATVYEWSEKLGYKNPQKFSYKFVRHFKVRPLKVLHYVRLRSIIKQLKSPKSIPNLDIALDHSLAEEKALNNFTNYHLGCSPSKLKTLSDVELEMKFRKFGNKIYEQI